MIWRLATLGCASLLLAGCWWNPPPDHPRFTATPVPGDTNAVWLLDTFTGSLARCEGAGRDKMPVCSPWASAPGEEPSYRYDPDTKKFIPMNEAARQRDEAKRNYCATHKDAKGRTPLDCIFDQTHH
jgi:hypothetical protein